MLARSAHQLDAPEQAAAADVADVRMIAERVAQQAARSRAPLSRTRGQQSVALDHLLHGERRGASHRVTEVRVAVLEEAAALRHRIDDSSLRQHGADRLVAAAQPFAIAIRSGTTPSCSHACSVPVRPMPHITSSRISRHAVAIADLAHAP